jgi:hypothetical protein
MHFSPSIYNILFLIQVVNTVEFEGCADILTCGGTA